MAPSADMAGREADEKGQHSKHTESKDQNFPRRRFIHVVLWDELPQDDVRKNDKNKTSPEPHA
jgi:hypothetical protein